MLSKAQKRLIARHPKVKVHYKEDMEEWGFTRLEATKYGKTVPTIYLKSNHINDDETLSDVVRVHEYGHIENGHLRINVKKQCDKITEINEKLGYPKLRQKSYHTILNIAMDIEVNSEYVTIPQHLYLENKKWIVCTASSYNVEPGLRYFDYFEAVLKKLHDDYEALDQETKDKLQQQAMMEDLMNGSLHASGGGSEDSDGEGQEGQQSKSKGSGNGDMNDLIEQIGKELSNQFGNTAGDAEENEKAGNGNSESEDENEGDGEKGKRPSIGKNSDGSDSEEGASSSGNIPGGGIGNSSVAGTKQKLLDPKGDTIATVIKQLMSYEKNYKAVYDSNILANRKSRGNTGLRYTSIRRQRKLTDKPKYLFVVDISGSMDSSLVADVISQIKVNSEEVSKKSELITWNTSFEDSFLIDELPNEVDTGGGTELSGSIDYAAEHGFNEVILITDFETYDAPLLNSLQNARGVDVNLIAYGTYEGSLTGMRSYEFIKHAWLKERGEQLRKLK